MEGGVSDNPSNQKLATKLDRIYFKSRTQSPSAWKWYIDRRFHRVLDLADHLIGTALSRAAGASINRLLLI